MAEEYSTLEDEQLLSRIREKDPEAFGELCARYTSLIRREAARFKGPNLPEQEDLLQEGYLALYGAAERFQPGRGATFRTFTAVCVRNRMADAVRRYTGGKNRALTESVPLEEAAAGDRGPEELLELRERFLDLRRRVEDLLSPTEKTALMLYLSGARRSEIEKRYGMNLRSFDNALYRVRSKLKSLR